MTCNRCRTLSCRICLSSSCVFTIGGVVVALPVVTSRRGVCDTCTADEEREAAFVERHLPFLVNGVMVQRSTTGALASLLSGSLGGARNEPVMLSIDVSAAAITWRSMQLVNNVPKETGTVLLAEVGTITGTSASGEPINTGAHGGAAGSSAAQPVGMRLASQRGLGLLTVFCTDSRQARRLIEAVSEALAVSRLAHCTAFPKVAAAGTNTAGSGSIGDAGGGGHARASSTGDARAQRSKEREAFRASLGPVGMGHTARIMAGGAGGKASLPSDHASLSVVSGGAGSGPGRPTSIGIRSGSGGSSAAASHSIRTGNLDADRVLNNAVAGLGALGTSAKGLFSNFSKPPPPAPAGDGGDGYRSRSGSLVGPSGLREASGSPSDTAALLLAPSHADDGVSGGSGFDSSSPAEMGEAAGGRGPQQSIGIAGSSSGGASRLTNRAASGSFPAPGVSALSSGSGEGIELGSASKALRPPRTNLGRGSAHPANVVTPPPPPVSHAPLAVGAATDPRLPPALPDAVLKAGTFLGSKLSAALTSLNASVPPTSAPPPSSSGSGGSAGGSAGGFSALSSRLTSRLDSSWFVDHPPAPTQQGAPPGSARVAAPSGGGAGSLAAAAAAFKSARATLDDSSGGVASARSLGGAAAAALSGAGGESAAAGPASGPGQLFRAGRRFGAQ